jgi:uncharacterized protein with PIN domain
LILRAKKELIDVLEVQTTDLTEQLAQVLAFVPVNLKIVLTRCTLCNSPLVSIEKNDVKAHIPPKVFETRDDFWYCPVCKKYYWMGTHYENMKDRITTLTSKNQG